MINQHESNVFYVGDFGDDAEDMVIPLTREIQRQRRFKDGRIDLYVNSYGGYAHLVFHMIELVELAKRNGIVVRTIVPNVAFSAGSMLAIAGTPGERYIAKHAEHLIHFGNTMGIAESTPKQIERWSSYKHRDFKETLDLYRRYTQIPEESLTTEMLDDGWIVPATKCVKWKIADKYLNKFDIGDNYSTSLLD